MSALTQINYAFEFDGTKLLAAASGVLFWPGQSLLCVSDLHFGKAHRYALRGGAALPPYETRDTLNRLDADIARFAPQTVVCLGDSFDHVRASEDLDTDARLWITRLQAGREWIWIEGNHDPGPVDLGGTHLAVLTRGPLTFRHIAEPDARGEISGHYHPKATLSTRRGRITRPSFAIDKRRIIMPAYGTYTGGLSLGAAALEPLLSKDAICVMTGSHARPVPRAALTR